MFGVILSSIGAFFEELASSIGKKQVKRKEESIYAMGFLNELMAFCGFVLIILFSGKASGLTLMVWPTALLRLALSLFQGYVTVNAIAKADRSTFGFIRTGTIPLLLIMDMVAGTFISGYQILGMLCISAGLLFLYMNHGFSKHGLWYVILSTVNAALTIGLYKYNITHGNSVELEQLLTIAASLVFFYVMSRYHAQEHPFALMKKPLLALQSGAIGVASVVESFAYLFAPASVILAATRSSTVVLTVLTGGVYFHEKNVKAKIFSLVAFVAGIILLAVG